MSIIKASLLCSYGQSSVDKSNFLFNYFSWMIRTRKTFFFLEAWTIHIQGSNEELQLKMVVGYAARLG